MAVLVLRRAAAASMRTMDAILHCRRVKIVIRYLAKTAKPAVCPRDWTASRQEALAGAARSSARRALQQVKTAILKTARAAFTAASGLTLVASEPISTGPHRRALNFGSQALEQPSRHGICFYFECVASPERLLNLYSAAFSVFGPCCSSTSCFAVR